MASSIFGNQSGNSILQQVNQTVDQLRGAANGDLNQACALLDRAGITRTLPNGQQVSASQFAQMMQGKTPEQGFTECGIDIGGISGIFR
jgi:hypothetical protein